jgi:hypothetical protein
MSEDKPYLNVINVVTVPCGTKKLVTESENENVLNHLLAQIMIDTEDFLLLPVGLQGLLQFPRASKILAEWFFNLRTSASEICSIKKLRYAQ